MGAGDDAQPALPRSRFLAPKKIDDLLNYQLSRLTAFAGAAVIKLCEGKYGITRREWHILARIADIGPISPSKLAEGTHIDRARVSRALTSLRDKGLIVRVIVHEEHQRAKIELTPTGRQVYASLFADVCKINFDIISSLDAASVANLDASLQELELRAKKVAEETQDYHADRWKGVATRVSWRDAQED